MGIEEAITLCRHVRSVATRLTKSGSGQATVEMAVAFPVLIIVAVIAVNATLFISDCAEFDRAFRQTVRTYACSPPYEQRPEQSCALVTTALDAVLDSEYLETSVSVSSAGSGHYAFVGTLNFSPNLFGRGFRDEVFGVALPHLTHETRLVVDVYKPGMLF